MSLDEAVGFKDSAETEVRLPIPYAAGNPSPAVGLKEDGGPSPLASPPNELPNVEAPPFVKLKLGVVGEVIVSFSSSSTTLEIEPELICSFPMLVPSPPKGLAFVPNRPGNVLPDMAECCAVDGGDLGDDKRNSERCDSRRFAKKLAQNCTMSVGFDLRTS